MTEAFYPQDPNARIMTPQSGETTPRNPWEEAEQEKFPTDAAVQSPVIGLAPGAPTQPQAPRGPEPGKPEFVETEPGARNEPVVPQVIGGKPAYVGEPKPAEPLVAPPKLPAEGILQKPVDVTPPTTSELPQNLLDKGSFNQYATPEQVRDQFLGGAVDPSAELARLDEQLPTPDFSDQKKQNLLKQLAAMLHLRS